MTEESKEDSEYTNAVDIWALGCVTFLLLAQKAPFTELRHITSFSRGWTQLPLDILLERKTSEEGISFIQALIAIESLKRPTARAALQSAWLESLGKEEGAPTSLQNLMPRPPPQVTSWDDHSDVKPAIDVGRDGDDPLDVNRSEASPRLGPSKLSSASLSVSPTLAKKQVQSTLSSVASNPTQESIAQLQLNEAKEDPLSLPMTDLTAMKVADHSNNTLTADLTSLDIAQIIDRRFRVIAARGHTPKLAALLHRGANIESIDRLGWTPLHLAVLSVSPPTVRMLLERGANVDAKTIHGLTPIDLAFAYACNGVKDVLKSWPGIDIPLNFKEMALPEERGSFLEAAKAGTISQIERLLEKGVSVEMEVGNGFSALHLAAESGHEMVVRLLLSKGARVQAVARFGWTALLCASIRGHRAVVELLLEAGADTSQSLKDGKSCVMLASSNGHEAIANLLRSWPDSLRKAAQVGDHLGVKMLLALAFDTDERGEKGRTALHFAAAEGHVEVVLLLLKVGAKVDALDDQHITPLIAASDEGHETVVRVLLDFGAIIDLSDGKQGGPLDYATRGGHEDVVRLLIEQGANIEAHNTYGNSTALHTACVNARNEVVLLLLEHNARIDARNRNGHTPLYLAIHNNHKATAMLLIEKGADTKARAQTGESLLHIAASQGHVELVSLLLSRGASINARVGRMELGAWNYRGETPLHWASAGGHEEVVRLLVEKGAHIPTKDKQGWTAEDWATDRGHNRIADYLWRRNTFREEIVEIKGLS